MLKLKSILTTLCLLPALSIASDHLTIAYEMDWPPYSSRDLKGKGIVPTIIKEATKELEITDIWAPWARVIYLGSKGTVTCISAAYRTQERESLFNYSEPYIYDDQAIVTNGKLQLQKGTIEELKGVRTGVIRSYRYPNFIRSTKRVLFFEASTNTRLFEMLINNRVDAIIINRYVATYILNTSHPELKSDIKIHKSNLDPYILRTDLHG